VFADALDELHYPFHDRTITVTQCGRISFGRRKINLSSKAKAFDSRQSASSIEP